MQKSIRVLGVMTGTSCDGLDAACLDIDSQGFEFLWADSAPFPIGLRKRVLEAQQRGFKSDLKKILELNRDLGDWFAITLSRIILKNKKRGLPEVIANHGQTVAHHPGKVRESVGQGQGQGQGMTLQMGDPTRIAAKTGLTVISNFRDGDMAQGGQGAPLVPLYHRILAHGMTEGKAGVSIHNIGGVSNFTYIGPKDEIIAFDTGPGNFWIDASVELMSRGKKKFDKSGAIALNGTVDIAAIHSLLKDPYFQKAPPKSTGRNDFLFERLIRATRARGADLVATATALSVESMARAYEKFILNAGFPLSQIFICGGGSKNPVLIEGLQSRLPEVEVRLLEDMGLDSQYIEAQAFAFFGFLSLLGRPLGGPWTGASGAGFAPPGHIIPGANWDKIAVKVSEYV